MHVHTYAAISPSVHLSEKTFLIIFLFVCTLYKSSDMIFFPGVCRGFISSVKTFDCADETLNQTLKNHCSITLHPTIVFIYLFI